MRNRIAERLRARYKPLVCLVCAAIAAGLAVFFPGGVAADGPLFDLMVAARGRLLSIFARPAAPESPVVVVALDRRSLLASRFASEPRALFAPHWEQLVNVLLDEGARLIVFDLVFVWSADQLTRGHDRSFIKALSDHHGQVVLAESHDLALAPAYYRVVKADSLGLAVFEPDADGVTRRAAVRINTTEARIRH
jgi:CHASE2 domain-containing sensor protein